MLGEYIGFDLYKFFHIKYKFEVVVGTAHWPGDPDFDDWLYYT